MKDNFQELIKNLSALIAIDSTETAPKGDMPFGEGVYNALKFMLDLGKSFGFTVKNYDNYIGEIIFEGKTSEAFAVLCHLDVVPVGNIEKWNFPPFSGKVEKDCVFGRGAVDDKGAAVAVLYVLKELKDEGFVPNMTVKLILGCDEESGWECIKHYKKTAKLPEIGFSPDADFPVIYAEKGIMHVKFSLAKPQQLVSASGGSAANVVCDYAEAVAPINPDLAKKFGLAICENKLIATGKTAHASTPQFGENAINKLINYLAEVGCFPLAAAKALTADSLGLTELSDETGNLTMSADIIEVENDLIKVTVDIRYPSTMSGKIIGDSLLKIAPYEILEHQKPLFNDKNSPLIKTLLAVYNEESGENAQPIAIGGGTYARALKCGVGFGPSFVGKGAKCHEPNEYISFADLRFLLSVYKKAIRRAT